MQDQVEDLITQFYPGLYTPMPPQQVGNQQPKRRRRRKSKSGESNSALKKRKLSDEQVSMLEMSFDCEHKLESERKDRLASELGLDPRQVAVWFQNRRARWKNKKLEDEYSKLKNEHETLVVDKCHLETEVLSLKDQLNDAKKEIQRLLEISTSSSIMDNGSTNSPSSSLTMDHHANVIDPQLLGDIDQLGLGFDGFFYAPSDSYDTGVNWVNLYDI